jgi:hypothetical protein
VVTAPAVTRSPAVDSTTAVAAALKRSGFGGGNTKLHSYGFLGRTDPGGKPVVAVTGEYRGNPAEVIFDAISGQMLQSCGFRRNPITCFGRIRSPVSGFRTPLKEATA